MMETADIAPGLIVAAPNMPDGRFARSVVLLAEANDDGALGFILNRPTDLTCENVGSEIGIDVHSEFSGRAVFDGGPVSPERGWILFRDPASWDDDEGMIHTVTEDVQLGASIDLLREFLTRRDTRPFKFLLGCSGWGDGQLEAELREGSWLPLSITSDLLFETPVEKLYDVALERLGLTPGTFLMTGGGTA